MPKYVDRINKSALALGYRTNVSQEDYGTRIRCNSFITCVVEFYNEGKKAFIWSLVRTTSWDFDGERTDLHEAISTLLAVLLRVSPLKISSSLWEVSNPAVYIDSEIYARNLVFEQPYPSGFAISEKGVESIEAILSIVMMCQRLIASWFDWADCDCEKCSSTPAPFLYDVAAANEWARKIAQIVGTKHVDAIPFPSLSGNGEEDTRKLAEYKKRVEATMGEEDEGIQFNARHKPTWRHYRNVNLDLSVLYAPQVTESLVNIIKNNRKGWQELEGVEGQLLFSDETVNCIPYSSIQWGLKILNHLERPTKMNGFITVPLENYLVIIGKSNLLFIKRDCGKKRFQIERERIRLRQARELKLLFPDFIWSQKIDGEEFELLILALLERLDEVRWIRKVSVGNERDGGRDLIAEWLTPPLPSEYIQENQNPYVKRPVIVQCKAYQKSVGKSKVVDIRDTIEHHDAQGFFLAVSSTLSTSLTDHLERIRKKGQYWINWWTRHEIEEKLRKHPDILGRFSHIVRANHE